MGPAIGDILPEAIGIAISPAAIIAVILMLFTPQARTNGPAFLAGWVIGLLVVGGIALAVSTGSDASTEETPSDLSFALKLLIGLAFFFLAYRQWQSRPKEGEEAETPAFMKAIDTFTPAKSFGTGALLAAVNPKNLGLALAAAVSIGQQPDLDGAEPWIVLIIFALLASASIGGAVLYYLLGGKSAEDRLGTLKGWMVQNNATIMTVLFVVLGAKLFGNGLGGLTD